MNIKNIIKDNNKAEFINYLAEHSFSGEDYYIFLREAKPDLFKILIDSDFNMLNKDEYNLSILDNCLEFNRNDVIPMIIEELLDNYDYDFDILDLDNFILKCILNNNYISPFNLLKYKPTMEENQLNYLLFLAVIYEDTKAITAFNLYGAQLDGYINGVSLYSIVLENNLKKINTLFKKLKGNTKLKTTTILSFDMNDYHLFSQYAEQQNLIYFRYFIGKYGKSFLYDEIDGESVFSKIQSNKNNTLNNINLMKK